MAGRNDDFLTRWSRRKAEEKQGLKRKKSREAVKSTPAPEVAPDAKGGAGTPAAAPAQTMKQAARTHETEAPTAETLWREQQEETVPVLNTPAAKDDLSVADEEALEAFKDVNFDKLDYASDYSRFMEKDVPEAIRRRALRALWGSNPILANVDGLNDYDEDFTDAALAVKGALKTAYVQGKGYLTDEEREASYSEEARKHAEESDEDRGARADADAAAEEETDSGPDGGEGEKGKPEKNDTT